MRAVDAEIIGRDEELAAIGSLLSSVAEGQGAAAVLLSGEAGIGKTTLLEAAVEAARERSFRVHAARPSEAEAKLSFAAVGDLLEPVVDDVLPLLPPPQRRSLEVALLIVEDEGATPNPRGVAVAFLAALRALARTGPVLLAVDDLQWLDTSSAGVIAFAARRLRDAPVGLLVAQRASETTRMPLALDTALPSGRFASIRVGPLAVGALHRMLHDRLGIAFPRPLLLRVLEASGRNPFFALEIGRALQRGELHPLPGEPLAVPRRLEEVVRDRIAALPIEARDVLAAAAVLSRPRLSDLQAAIGDDAGSGLQSAIEAEVVLLDGDVIRFAHPLLGSAACSATPPLRRRELHRRLAEVVEDVEERARHLASGTYGTDPAVADALEQAARRARARGALAIAAEFAEKAVELTPRDQAEQALARRLDAAAHHFEAGDPARARRLLEDALAAEAPRRERAEVRTRLARVHAFEADLRSAAALYREALEEAEDDSETRIEAEGGLAIALMRMLEDLPAAERHARSASDGAARRGDAALLSELLARRALIEGLLARDEALEHARRAADVEAGAARTYDSVSFMRGVGGAAFTRGILLSWRDDIDGARVTLDVAHSRAVEIGDESSLPLLLGWRAYASWLAGDWESALRDAGAGYEAAIQTGQPSQRGVLAALRALVLAHLGRVSEARTAANEGLRLASATGSGFAVMHGRAALGFLELSLGNPVEADRHLGPLIERMDAAGVREPGAARFVPDEIEALIALGRLDEAEALLVRLERRARRLDRASALAAAGRCRALLAGGCGDADAAFSALERALANHDRVPIPFDRARTLVALGEVSRRAKRRRRAREALEGALGEFDRLGAEVWVARARADLARVGGRAPSRAELTPAERQIAALVARGHRTKEVAAQLFLSPKTVEGHLSRIYGKLGVRSRAELARTFRDE
jgi:DNA-binding CsgD family transcriptional regulator